MSSFTTPLVASPIDDRHWAVLEPFSYDVGKEGSGDTITVPRNFITDFASVPRVVNPMFTLLGLFLVGIGLIWWGVAVLTILCILSWFRKWGRHGKAAIIHDFLYQTQARTRKEADDIFREGMEVLEEEKWRIFVMYWGVRLFGWMAWHSKKN